MVNIICEQEVTEGIPIAARMADEVDPDWYKGIDTETLRMENPNHCIVGQLYPDVIYSAGIVWVFGEDPFTSFREYCGGYGFFLSDVLGSGDELWIKEIEDRRYSEVIEEVVEEQVLAMA
jgi:hypothetical protein